MSLNYKKTIYVGFAFMIICMFWQVYDSIIVKMLINSFGLNQLVSGIIMALDNALALILLPIFGIISDRTKSRYGKRTPFIFWGVIISAILFVGVAYVDKFQQELVHENNIGDVVEYHVPVVDETYFRFDGDSENRLYNNKEEAANARALYVLDVTRSNSKYLYLFIGVLFFVLIAMSVYRTPAVSLMPDITLKPLRSKANAVINLMGAVGGIFSIGLMTFLAVDYQSYVLLFLVLGISMILFLAIFMYKVNEPKLLVELEAEQLLYKDEDNEEKTANFSTNSNFMSKEVKISFILIMTSIVLWFMGYNAATTKFSDYAGVMLNMGFALPLLVAQGTAIVLFIPIGNLSSRIGRKKTIIGGIIILFIAFVLGSIATASTKFLIFITMGLAGVGWASINVNSYPMVVEMAKGNNIGKFTGYYYTASMAAQIITPILSGYLMDLVGRRVLFIYSAFFCILALLTMLGVKHGDSKPIRVKSALEAYGALDD